MTPQELRKSVEQIESIPSPSFSLNRILELASDSESEIAQLAASVETDPAVTARVLRLANSAYFGVARDVGSVGRAIMVVGYTNVLSLAVCAALAPAFQGQDTHLDRSALWMHSCGTAEASRIVAAHLGFDPATAHAAGLLHDLGAVVLSEVLGEEYGKVVDAAFRRGESLAAVEQEILGVAHPAAAGFLFDRWDLPLPLVAAVVHHHEPQTDNSGLAAVVALADHLAVRAGFLGVTCYEPSGGPSRELRGLLGLEETDVDKFASELEERRAAIELLAGARASP